MLVIWDEPKRLSNIDKHNGLDFADLDLAFFADATIVPAKSGRFQAIGMLNGRAVIAVFSILGTEALSVISLRPASSVERKRLR